MNAISVGIILLCILLVVLLLIFMRKKKNNFPKKDWDTEFNEYTWPDKFFDDEDKK